MTLSKEKIESYVSDGYLAGIPVMSTAETNAIRQHFGEVEDREGPEKCQKGLFDPHFTDSFVWELATYPRILDCIRSFIGPNILLMATHFFCKYGPREAFVAWHQDVTYWGLDPSLAISAWYAVDDSDAGNGCVQVIPGSHKMGILPHGKADVAGNLLSVNQEARLAPGQAAKAVNLELKAGEISLHDGLIVHGSQPNRSTRRRCGLAMIYIPTYVRQIADNSLGESWKALLVSGVNQEGHFRDVPHPFPIAKTNS